VIPGYFLRSARGRVGEIRNVRVAPDAMPLSEDAAPGAAPSGAGATQSGVVTREALGSSAGAAESGVINRDPWCSSAGAALDVAPCDEVACSSPRHDDRFAPAALVGREEQGIRFERLIAVGGIGAVYAVQLAETGQRAALKVLRREHARDAGVAGRFVR